MSFKISKNTNLKGRAKRTIYIKNQAICNLSEKRRYVSGFQKGGSLNRGISNEGNRG